MFFLTSAVRYSLFDIRYSKHLSLTTRNLQLATCSVYDGTPYRGNQDPSPLDSDIEFGLPANAACSTAIFIAAVKLPGSAMPLPAIS